MKTMHLLKTILLFCAVSFFVGCNDGDLTVLAPETDTEILSGNNNGTFVSSEQASDVAAFFFCELLKERATKSNLSVAKTIASLETVGENGDPLMYIINYKNGGFIILSATRDYYPVLAYSEENAFVVTPDQEPIINWLKETKEAIRESDALDDSTKLEMRHTWAQYEPNANAVSSRVMTKSAASNETQMFSAYVNRLQELESMPECENYLFYSLVDAGDNIPDLIYEELCTEASILRSPYRYTIVGFKSEWVVQQVGPLLTTKWGQGGDLSNPTYNGMCPNYAVPGCTAIAIAQIMKFHQYPARFNWNNMPNASATIDVQTLIRDVADAVRTDYSTGSATTGNAKTGFESYGYTARLTNHNPTEVNSEISARRPVWMRGSDTQKGGHAWVCDGKQSHYSYDNYFVEYILGSPGVYYYDSYWSPSVNNPCTIRTGSYNPIFFHMNWGWEGVSDGWYHIQSVNTNYNGNYQNGRQNIYVSRN
jgi:Peptidase C10 family.